MEQSTKEQSVSGPYPKSPQEYGMKNLTQKPDHVFKTHESLQAMDRQERHRLKRWLDDCFAQKKILPLPAEEHFVPTPPPPPPSERPSRYGGHWWD
ncbi:MAG: hypothetical protein PHN33_05245 [Candidatus Peribacteraceae bacterium]|nr:hypothetical protein [Candidatus Peribacteraceae bacterium]